MARLSEITSKSQVAPEGHAAVDSIVSSRGSLQGPFTMFLHAPEMAGRVAHLGAYVRFEGELDMKRKKFTENWFSSELLMPARDGPVSHRGNDANGASAPASWPGCMSAPVRGLCGPA